MSYDATKHVKVSVIIPSYRPGNYLATCLQSLHNQTFPSADYEVIIVLNGPKDGYWTSINDMLAAMPKTNWRLLYCETAGVSHARNMGLEAARGEYIAFIDDDDFVSADYLKGLYANAAADTVPLCYPLSFVDGTEHYKKYRITHKYERLAAKQTCSVRAARSFFGGPVYKLLHRSIIGETRFDTRLKNGEDTLFMFLISRHILKCRFASRDCIYYRRLRADSATGRRRTLADAWQVCRIQLKEYLKAWIAHPTQYNFHFFFTRVRGAIRGLHRR